MSPFNILSINSGSSSVKVTAYKAEGKRLTELAAVEVGGLTSSEQTLQSKLKDSDAQSKSLSDVNDQNAAFKYILKHLKSEDGPKELQSDEDFAVVTHRVVHGGGSESPKVVDDEVINFLEELSDLAPLHNAPALAIIREAKEQLPKAVSIVYFDTTFHNTIPKHFYSYAIDQKVAKHNKLRRYGFHGISYKFVLQSVATFIKKDVSKVNLIVLHLGSGASACCIRDGQSLDTSMGLTPVSGLPGATRSGDIDPSLVFHYTHEAGKLSSASSKDLHITKAEEILNKQSGWKAITGTADFGEITQKMQEGDETCQLAFDIFKATIVNFVSQYYVKLEGDVDALVFAGGIGEHSVELRQAVTLAVKCLGFELNSKKSKQLTDGTMADLTGESSKHKILLCRTDEQYQVAKDVLEVDGLLEKVK